MTATNAILHSARHKRRARIRLSRAQETTFGVLLIMHAIAHSIVGVWASAQFEPWAVVPLWEIGTVGFLVAGLGASGVRYFRRLWREVAIFAAFGSTMLLFAAPAGVFTTGFGLNLLIGSLAANSHSAHRYPSERTKRYPRLRLAGTLLAALLVAYVGSIIALRPWTSRWGTTASDISARLPGDKASVILEYRIDHAVAINAPPSSARIPLQPKWTDVGLAPISVFVFEPARFIIGLAHRGPG